MGSVLIGGLDGYQKEWPCIPEPGARGLSGQYHGELCHCFKLGDRYSNLGVLTNSFIGLGVCVLYIRYAAGKLADTTADTVGCSYDLGDKVRRHPPPFCAGNEHFRFTKSQLC